MAVNLRTIDPLFQFLAAGALLVGLSAIIRPLDGSADTIRVDHATLEQYIASGGGEALAPLARNPRGKPDLDALNTSQRRELVRKYVEEQALYLEARSWGLDEGDLVIRRRLGQSMRFALRPVARPDPGDGALRAFHAAHADNYRNPAEISFDHVFFSTASRGESPAMEAARNLAGQPMGDWRAQGDRFPYQRSYVDAGPGIITSQMGAEFAAEMARVPVDPARWQGPVRSSAGVHLVRVHRRRASGIAPFETVRAAVLDDWQRQSQDDELDRAVAKIMAKYRVSGSDAVLTDGDTQ